MDKHAVAATASRGRRTGVRAWRLVVLGTVLGPAVGATLAAQTQPHPRDMQFPAGGFTLPDTNRFRILLENRLMAFVVPDPTVPLVRFTAFVRGGYGDDDTPGAAEALAVMMATRGPCWLGTQRLEGVLEELAAEFSVRMGPEMTEISLNVAATDARDGLRLFSGVVRETCVDPMGLEAFRVSVGQAAAADAGPDRYDGSLDAAVGAFRDLLFEGHRYGDLVTVAQAAALELDDVDEFYREYFSPINVTLAVSGAFDMQDMVNTVDQRFADWEDRRPPSFRRAPGIDTPEPREVTTIPVADKLQTWIVIGHELPPVEPRDYPALEVMNYILGGGHFDTRLFRETRDKRGLTNDASGFLEPNYRGPGSYTFRTYGRPEVAQQLVDIVLAEIARIREGEVTEEELSVAKGALADGAFPYRFRDGHAAAHSFALEWARYVTFDHLVRYRERLRDVDAGDVRRAARRYLHPERMRVVMLGSIPPEP